MLHGCPPVGWGGVSDPWGGGPGGGGGGGSAGAAGITSSDKPVTLDGGAMATTCTGPRGSDLMTSLACAADVGVCLFTDSSQSPTLGWDRVESMREEEVKHCS